MPGCWPARPLIGFAAQALGLPAALLIVAALLLGVAVAGRSLRV